MQKGNFLRHIWPVLRHPTHAFVQYAQKYRPIDSFHFCLQKRGLLEQNRCFSLFFCETLFDGFMILSSKTWTFRAKRIFCLQKRGLSEQNAFSIKTAFFALYLIIMTMRGFAFLSSKTWTFRAKRILSSKTWTFRAKRLEKCRNLVFCDFFKWLFNTKSGSFCLQKRGLSEQNAFFVFKNVDF